VDRHKLKDKMLKWWTSLVAPLPILFVLVIPTTVYKGIMLLPVITYLSRHLPRLSEEPFYEDLQWLFLHPSNIPGWVIAGLGFLLSLVALTTMLRKRGRLLTSGLYGKVRHPQYLGLIVMTWGVSAVSVIWRHFGGLQFASDASGYLLNYWVVVALAYVVLAYLEEQYLLRTHAQEYKEYKERVPFLFPVPHPKRIPQPIFDLGVIILFSFVLVDVYPRIVQVLI